MSTTFASTGQDTIDHWIDGQTIEQSGPHLDVINPGSGDVVGSVGLADRTFVDRPVASSAEAFKSWSRWPLSRRVPVLRAFRRLLAEHSDDLARLISKEHGKLVPDASGEIARGLEVVDLACAAPTLLRGRYSDQVADGIDTFSMRLPVGVCVGITPFNFPAMVPLWMFPVALACGNTFILKPSEQDPSASLLLARLLTEAGLPPGVFNVVHGDRVAVEALVSHPAVRAISFVGSTAVARSVYERGTAAGKRVQALGGAKNHLVVLPDADIELAADAAVSAAFGSAGQRCMATSVVVAVGSAATPLVEAIHERVRTLRVGPASDPNADMGPVITLDAEQRVRAYIESGEQDGAEIVSDGRRWVVAGNTRGTFIGPTVLDHVTSGMAVYTDEVFGPLLSIVRGDSLDDALRLIGANTYGNGAAIYTASGRAARRFAQEVEAGMVGINVPIPVPVGFYSFGGWGDSLFGDTHVYGPEGFHFYTRGKVVTSRWPEQDRGIELTFPGS